MHLREDRRHIQDRDLEVLREVLSRRMNLEMAVTDEMIDIALKIKPHDVCLVPERRQELTTEGGLDVLRHSTSIKRACGILGQAGIRVSLFINADERQIEEAWRVGAPVIELHTGHYAEQTQDSLIQETLEIIQKQAKNAHQMGLRVNAGHGLNYHNTQLVARIPEICELNIGHAIVAQALFVGWERAVRDMKELIVDAQRT